MTATTVDRRSLRLIVAALLAAVLLSSLDAMIFNTALPAIVGQLHGIAACPGYRRRTCSRP